MHCKTSTSCCIYVQIHSIRTHHQLLIDDHLADDAVNCGYLQFKHLRECRHAGQTKMVLVYNFCW